MLIVGEWWAYDESGKIMESCVKRYNWIEGQRVHLLEDSWSLL